MEGAGRPRRVRRRPGVRHGAAVPWRLGAQRGVRTWLGAWLWAAGVADVRAPSPAVRGSSRSIRWSYGKGTGKIRK